MAFAEKDDEMKKKQELELERKYKESEEMKDDNDSNTFNPWILINSVANENNNNHLWFATPLLLNHNELISASNSSDFIDKKDGIWIFDTKQCKSSLLIEYKDLEIHDKYNFKMNYHSICLDSNKNELYIIAGNGSFIWIDLNKKCVKYHLQSLNQLKYGIYSKSIFIKNQLHLIGGLSNKDHLILNTETQEFDIIHTFPQRHLYGFSLIYSKSRDILYLFDTNKSVHSFNVKTQTWLQFADILPFEIFHNCYVLTMDEKYVLIFIGEYIHTLDLDKMEVKKTNIKIPKYNNPLETVMATNVVIDELLVNGYLRNEGLPNEIMEEIFRWHNAACIYLFGYYTLKPR